MKRGLTKIDQPGGALRRPGMLREDTQRILKANLGKVVAEEKRGPKKAPGGLAQNTAPHKTALGSKRISFGFGGPGTTDPI